MKYILAERLPNCNRNQGKINEWALLHFGVISVGNPEHLETKWYQPMINMKPKGSAKRIGVRTYEVMHAFCSQSRLQNKF